MQLFSLSAVFACFSLFKIIGLFCFILSGFFAGAGESSFSFHPKEGLKPLTKQEVLLKKGRKPQSQAENQKGIVESPAQKKAVLSGSAVSETVTKSSGQEGKVLTVSETVVKSSGQAGKASAGSAVSETVIKSSGQAGKVSAGSAVSETVIKSSGQAGKASAGSAVSETVIKSSDQAGKASAVSETVIKSSGQAGKASAGSAMSETVIKSSGQAEEKSADSFGPEWEMNNQDGNFDVLPLQEPSLAEETPSALPKNVLSENFVPTKTDQEVHFWDVVSDDVSWFFQDRPTKHKVGLAPVYSYDKSYGSRLGLRLFSYSADKKSYYLSLSGARYLLEPFYSFSLSYIGSRKEPLRSEVSFLYDDHYENYYGQGMQAQLDDIKKLSAYRFMAGYDFIYQKPEGKFYAGLGAQFFIRKRKGENQEDELFKDEFIPYLKSFAGYDSRDNWKDPKTGAYHRLSFGCAPVLSEQSSYCRAEGDFRLYIPLFKEMIQENSSWESFRDVITALRAFAGASLFAPSTYSLMYSLGGRNIFQKFDALRGFNHNRFIGHKIYLAQAELRFPIWSKYFGGVVFAELGETADYGKSFEGFVIDYGGGLRVGLPPGYDIKIRLDVGTGLDKEEKRNYGVTIAFFHAF